MASFGGNFELSRWFNDSSSKCGASSAHATDSEDGDAAAATDEAFADAPAGGLTLAECYICRMPNPEYMSTNTVKKAPPVPVCSMACETKYLEKKGMRPKGEARTQVADPMECYVCQTSNPEYMTTNAMKRIPSVPVCSKECESTYLRQRKQRLSAGQETSSSKRSKSDALEPAKRQRRSLNFLGDQLLDSADSNGYKSWWLGALTFYDFVYQRHGMWHSLLSLAKRGDDNQFLAGDRDLTVAAYLETLEQFLQNIDDCTVAVKRCTTSEGIFETMRKFQENVLGSFTCWQVVCDLMELHMLAEDFVTDEFVWLTVDAKKSLVQIFGKNRARPSEFVALARLLEQRQVQGFKALRVDFPFFMNQKLDLKNIGHALHGFQVYRNIKLLEQKQLHKQEPGTTHPVAYQSRSYMMDTENCEICSQAENDDQLVLCDMCNRMFHKYCINMKELPPASWVCAACKTLQNYPQEGLIVEREVISID
ncbi:hypothetical protein BBJ28_00005251 [Nothophytophthora sp. Chile5]|nr:hypothetical protein BBJ28_00005251 [Nothophytophthora sp. Chile5]